MEKFKIDFANPITFENVQKETTLPKDVVEKMKLFLLELNEIENITVTPPVYGLDLDSIHWAILEKNEDKTSISCRITIQGTDKKD